MIDQAMQRTTPGGLPKHLMEAAAQRPRDAEVYAFGAFIVHPWQRVLMLDGKTVEIGSRAFDLLVVLLRSSGEIVSKDSITRYVWPTTIVDESNLRFQMASLRRALGIERERVKTIPGRGYLLVGDTTSAPSWTVRSPEIARPAEARFPTRTAAIVIIDEDPENREALCRLLQPLDANVQSFVSLDAFMASGPSRAGSTAEWLSAMSHTVSHQLITDLPCRALSSGEC